jgi:secretion/DNA translocation related CpaE-like protein
MSTPLFITDDDVLLEELLRLAAAAGVTPEVARDAGTGLRSWLAAPLVLVGLDQAAGLIRLAPPRRPSVHVTTLAETPDDVYRTALRVGAQDVAVLPKSEEWLVEALTDIGDPSHALGLTLGVIGGCGGAGASTFACALARAATRCGPALVIDADPQGPGLDRVLGTESREGIRWDALEQTTGRLSARSLRESVPTDGGLGVLTWVTGRSTPLQAFAARAALSAAQRGFDTVVLDLPRAEDTIAGESLSGELVARCDHLIVVTTGTVLGASATARMVGRFPGSSPRLVVRGPGVRAGEFARLTRVPTVVEMPNQRGLDEGIDLGLGPVRSRRGPLARAAREVLETAVRREPGR